MITAKRKHLKIASFSDCHVGHRNTPTEKVLSTLSAAFPDNATTGELDLIVIAGDFFDKMLQLPTNCVTRIHQWIHTFLKMCKRWDIKVRVLEGTPSHDRKQNALFPLINDLSGLDVDIKWMDTLSIEHIDAFGIDVLYLPDEYTTCCKKTEGLVKKVLESHGLSQVDYVVMHGMFDYRLPIHLASKGHSAKFYQRITRKYVLCGHVHTMNKHGNILEAGSSERTTHGEEGDKGHWRIHEGADADELIFVKHENTTIYRTIDVSSLEYTELTKKLNEYGLGNMPVGSYIRLKCIKGDEAITSIANIREEFANIRFTHLVEERLSPEEELVVVEDDEQIVEITSDNIIEATLEMASSQGKLSDNDTETMRGLLNGLTA